MKEHIGKIVLGLFSFCCFISLIAAEYAREGRNMENRLFFQVGEEVIQGWKKENRCYLFLPSYVSKKEVRPASYSAEIGWLKEEEIIPLEEGMEEIENDRIISCQQMDSGEKFEFCIMQSENIPALFIHTRSDALEALKMDKELRVSGVVVTIDSNGERGKTTAIQSIGGRGNTSFAGYDKKPFSLTLVEETSLLGLPAGKNYALISNASDPSLIRNDLARRMEQALELKYSQTGQFVDLYVDGNYEGNYYLCADIEIGTERIDIADMESTMDLIYRKNDYEAEEIYETDTVKARKLEFNPTDLTGGYLMEREYVQRFEQEYGQISSGFITDSQEHFVMKSPKYCSEEQIEYIYNYVNEAEKAIMSADGVNKDTGKTYEEYLDIDSFVKKYLVEEITKNYDGGVSSSYYYKDSDANGGKLCAGPGWDYDMSLGNYVEWMEEFSKDPTGISKLTHHTYASSWYEKLYEKKETEDKIKEYYFDYAQPFLEEFLDLGIGEYEKELMASAKMNEIRWEEELEENIYFEDREQVFRELKEFVLERKEFLDQAWGE